MKIIGALLIPFLLCLNELYADTTKVVYLSGLGKDNTVNWDFYCTGGRNSGYWTTIPVPSCWEQQGFGTYNYGGSGTAGEHGIYRHTFNIPTNWQGKHIFIVFDGSMTDTDVKINGKSAGDIHQGAFYRFQYEITNLVRYDIADTLDVEVSKNSSNSTVNGAERNADYWIFGGIFRPVYLKVVPGEYIDRTAINAKADGSFSIDVYLQNIAQATMVEAQIEDINGIAVGTSFSQSIVSGQTKISLQTNIANPQTWTAETPNLYRVGVKLKQGGTEIHSIKERFGFRTIELRVGDGVYVNGKKIMMKGTNRHSFHPQSGRTLNDSMHVVDVELMKDMNNNAVRMSHYPPDAHFLDVCDEKGIYVLDELAGWQHMYDATVGEKLVGEMVRRDVNHPCVVIWDNGNEGGWNTALDSKFSIWDPQNRTVNHPGQGNNLFNGLITDHYESYSSVSNYLNGSNIYMTTEFLHGLFDGGSGAGLNDYWKLMTSKPLSAGGFLWAFLDEGVARTDRNGAIDVNGNSAPDGILGPYREKEGSFYAIKEIWSPIYIEMDTMNTLPANFDGRIAVKNRYSFINLNQCSFEWKLVDFYKPNQNGTGCQIKKNGTFSGPSVAPGSSGTLQLNLPSDWQTYNALYLKVKDHTNREIYTYTWPIKKAINYIEQIVAFKDGKVTKTEDASYMTIQTNEHEFQFDKSNGNLASVKHNGHKFSISQGPVLCLGTRTLSSMTSSQDGNDYIVEATYTGNMAYAHWRINASGWIQLQYKYSLTGSYDYMGVSFTYPEDSVNSIKWLGQGPYRVYKDRMKGVTFNVWQKDYNNTVTGASGWKYPEFKGYHANVYWAAMVTKEGTMTVVSEEEKLFLRLFTPATPTASLGSAVVSYPNGNISFLDGIPPIGDKFTSANQFGPEGQKNTASGDYSRTLYFFFDNEQTVEVKDYSSQIPPGFSLEQNFPNPFNPTTVIRYTIPLEVSHRTISLRVFDVLGREVAVLMNEEKSAGTYKVEWDAAKMASGIYFYQLHAGSIIQTKSMILLR